MKIAGLDIGSTSIKLVEVKQDKGKAKLFAADFMPTPPRGILSESEVDQNLLAGTLKKLVGTAKIDTTKVNVSLPESQVFTRVIDMPALSDKELSSAIRWEGEQYIPLPLVSVSLDWEVLSRDSEKNRMEVLLVGAPTTLISKYQKIIEMAGLTVASVETEIIASARALILPQEKSTPTAILDIGATSTDLGIFKNGNLVVSYTVPTGGSALTRAIEAEFALSPAQAQQYKLTYGVESSVLEGKIAKALSPILGVITSELKKAINFYQGRYQDKVGRIILSGGDARLPGLPAFFANNIGIESEVANPWKGVEVDSSQFKKQLENSPIYSIAVGLALRVI